MPTASGAFVVTPGVAADCLVASAGYPFATVVNSVGAGAGTGLAARGAKTSPAGSGALVVYAVLAADCLVASAGD